MDDFSIILVFVASFCSPLLLFLLFAIVGVWFEGNEKGEEPLPEECQVRRTFLPLGKLPEMEPITITILGIRIKVGERLADRFDTSNIPEDAIINQVHLRVSLPEEEKNNER